MAENWLCLGETYYGAILQNLYNTQKSQKYVWKRKNRKKEKKQQKNMKIIAKNFSLLLFQILIQDNWWKTIVDSLKEQENYLTCLSVVYFKKLK